MFPLHMIHRPRHSSASGFTLVELLVVLVILGLLAGLVGPRVLGQLGGAKSKTTAVQVKDFEQAAELFKLDVGRFPNRDEGLDALTSRPGSAPGWNGPYLKKGEVPKDPWGNPYHYESPGKHTDIDIFSLGADNALGGEGENADIGNWQ
ncbi:type II secretion system major pseudopilin GspG [Aromatoleum aromaticum]|uniref:Type II secretion system core protein G n=1 Tax=Aromatoleum aromaticum (strain DSM 19018 / LMG 30748 / EbN1) TaxID=76114 RepID=Q5P6Q6_AROAE|nr:type II secretion system major pseudopilin GspG [Aromatoleum aromaticum]NMG53972.1 type II secretion system major pseudopilin GspG [Aromatoleum aromaticum]CAI07005.1 general secretion pathway protein G [Aromatoleum aromaticum EbN1]